jgi:hypothetical protein
VRAFMRMPLDAAMPEPTMTAVGAASPTAHGHAMTSTLIPAEQERHCERYDGLVFIECFCAYVLAEWCHRCSAMQAADMSLGLQCSASRHAGDCVLPE